MGWKSSGFVLCVGVLVPLSSAQSRRLNGRLLPEIVGDIEEFLVSPDGAYVVYRADQETDQVFELYSALADGSGAGTVKLNGPLIAGGDVGEP